jgi:hypothetical protein
MRIEVVTTFLDGRDRYEAGDVRSVSEEDGARFIANGWAKRPGEPDPQAKAGVVSLAVQNSLIGVGDSNG